MKLWEKLTSARYNAGYRRGITVGKQLGRQEELEYITLYLKTRLKEFAEPFNDDAFTLGFATAVQELKEMR
jgi:hypothetical protein